MKTTYIFQLPDAMRQDIHNEVQNALYELGFRDEALEREIETAMESRLCDLEDTIDIKKYLVVGTE
ncbi:hypothetical protein [Bacillus sp. 165]|uniref:hypothetical protein n=1 Tax=Bacillus sp. 165 TaxID=1529117 RepID=UPI001ADCA6F4|nr:hypothetical protein [Bacillus sp. 165]MBO9131431.1 hypothetical protein [Bacillus sp. 165]